jgi:hypothetical protein
MRVELCLHVHAATAPHSMVAVTIHGGRDRSAVRWGTLMLPRNAYSLAYRALQIGLAASGGWLSSSGDFHAHPRQQPA